MFLESEKIKLRAPEPEDLDILYKWENDTELWALGSTLAPYSRYELKQYILSIKDIYEAKQLRFIIEKKASETASLNDNVKNPNQSHTAVGAIDLYDFDAHNRRAAVGIIIDKHYQQNGLATEALSLLCEYAFFHLKLHQLYAFIPMKNEPSKKLFKHCKFEEKGLLPDWLQTAKGYDDVQLACLVSKD